MTDELAATASRGDLGDDEGRARVLADEFGFVDSVLLRMTFATLDAERAAHEATRAELATWREKAFEERGFTSHVNTQLHAERAKVARLREALEDALEKLRSAHHVAEAYVTADRTVGETSWRPLRDRLHESIKRHVSALADTAPDAKGGE